MTKKDIRKNNKIDIMVNNYVLSDQITEGTIECLELPPSKKATAGVLTLKVTLPQEVLQSLRID